MLLRQMLYRCEIRFLPVIAGFWLNLQRIPDYEELIRMLCTRMTDPVILRKKLTDPASAGSAKALSFLIAADGIVPTAEFEEKFGPLRVVGLERILREKLWKSPVSVTEELWYRGMIFRENRFLADKLTDCYILPQDLMAAIRGMLPDSADFPLNRPALTVRPAIPSECSRVPAFSDNIPDIFTLAAALKRDRKPLEIPGFEMKPARQRFLEMLLREGEFFSGNGDADSEKIRTFLIRNRPSAKLQLIRIWRNARGYDELSEETESLHVQESPEFDRTLPRAAILQLLTGLQPDTWWSVSGLVSAVKRTAPDFLRSSFHESHGVIFDREGNDLNGMGGWYQLEGAYIRFLLFGPLQWLGIVQPAFASQESTEPSAFRISQEALFYLSESAEAETSESIRSKPNLEQAHPTVAADGAITCSSKVPRYFRFMAARFCEIEKYKAGVCTFRITPGSLSEAESNGISRDQVLSLLKRFAEKAIPPTLEQMLHGDGGSALPATIYPATILTIPSADLMQKLLETSRLEKWVLQQLNPNSLLIDPKGTGDIRRFLMENGMFVDIQT